MVRGALCGGLLLLGGCVVVMRDNAPPANLPLVRQIQQEALRVSPPPDMYVAPERLAERSSDFSINLRRTLLGPMPPSDADMALLLRLFALTLEEVPEGERVGTSVAAAEMQEAAAAMRGPGLSGSPPLRAAFVRGFSVGVETLLALAEGPYGGATNDLVDRTTELESSYAVAMGEPQPMRYEVALEVMRRAQLVLKEIEEIVSMPAP
ncbi:hypothetical protein [Polyangium jinanense]|uniref:Lipoprotein n=1 Tax=Polyangium jinanense TaxID=2829994 RepID=A0A9X3X9C7_9BACT|nr:hypothetical protein [Polyangium jinanense]MDC3956700.1 hypothetical protein [Polyangium jinanense]MDC3984763.1 hypothetical protein [Polyangium jinanense]